MAKRAINFNLEKEQDDALEKIKRQTGVAKSAILRLLITRFLPQIGEELTEEARKRLNDGRINTNELAAHSD